MVEKKAELFPLVTIDGPAASGKTTLSRELARLLNVPFVTTGAFYRALAYLCLQEKLDPQNERSLLKALEEEAWELRLNPERTLIFLDGIDVTDVCSQEKVGSLASVVSSHPKVRARLLQSQRDCYRSPGLVAEGRDCGTVVFPQAAAKFYLTARSESRADRRAQELGLSRDELVEEQKQRDYQDQTRKTAPLQIPPGAHVIDTSELSIQEVIEKTWQLARQDLGMSLVARPQTHLTKTQKETKNGF